MIYHVATESDWNAHRHKDYYIPAAFEREGFIHSCHLHQLEGVLQRYYSGRSDLMLLHIDEQKLTCQLKEEKATGGEPFPHLYGKLNKEAIVKVVTPFSF